MNDVGKQMKPRLLVHFIAAVQIKIFSESSVAILKSKMAQNGNFQAQNGHFKAFLDRQEGNEEYSKVDETKVTSTVYHCHSDDNTFGELLGHFEIQNGHF